MAIEGTARTTPYLRVGDVLRITCPFTATHVTHTTSDHITVKWPWWASDPDCDWIEWNGQVALAGNPRGHDWETELFRTDPPPENLSPGVPCRVGIPPTIVHVIEIGRFDPPMETGRLPRPQTLIVVLRAGTSFDPEREDQGYDLDPDDDIPLSVEHVHRPYDFLELGDEIADADGRAWHFQGPWDWHPFDRSEPHRPAWPLTLLTRQGRPDDLAAETIRRATTTGSHEQQIGLWTKLTRAQPVPTSPRTAC